RIADLVERLRRAVGEDGAAGDPEDAREEVARLTAELEAHLTYEEEQLIPLLDAAAG
ncbi:hemerythrin domain-containing protein, partial [Streptomyces sp. NPDC054756]